MRNFHRLHRHCFILFSVTLLVSIALFLFARKVGDRVIFSSGHSFIRLGGCLTFFATNICIWWKIWIEFRDRFFTTWWNPDSSFSSTLTWDTLRQLIVSDAPIQTPATHREIEPLTFISVPENGLIIWIGTIGLLVAYTILGCELIVGLLFLANPHVPAFIDPTNRVGVTLNFSGNLTAFLALLAAFISVYFTYRQFQAKVRADNRQIWIAELRKLLARTTASAVESATGTPLVRRKNREQLDRVRLRLELMLNPKERDHRLLMYLIQRLALLRTTQASHIDDAKNLRSVIRNSYASEAAFESDWNIILDNSNPGDLVGYIMRLSHVVLKREWERVKKTR